MHVEIVAKADHQVKTARALAEGFGRHGVSVSVVSGVSQSRGPIVAAWGWRNGQVLAARGARVLVMERAYVGDRFHWISLGWDGLNGNARFPDLDDGGQRWALAHGIGFRHRRDPGEKGRVLVLGQVPGDMSLKGWPGPGWYMDAGETVREWGLEPVFRPHPLDPARVRQERAGSAHGMAVTGGHLRDALDGAAAVIAWNSNSLTDAALHGVPILAGSPGAMTWPLAGRSLEDKPRLGERGGRWATRMAFAQWEPAEIAAGVAWDALRTCIEPGTGHKFGDWREDLESVSWPRPVGS